MELAPIRAQIRRPTPCLQKQFDRVVRYDTFEDFIVASYMGVVLDSGYLIKAALELWSTCIRAKFFYPDVWEHGNDSDSPPTVLYCIAGLPRPISDMFGTAIDELLLPGEAANIYLEPLDGVNRGSSKTIKGPGKPQP